MPGWDEGLIVASSSEYSKNVLRQGMTSISRDQSLSQVFVFPEDFAHLGEYLWSICAGGRFHRACCHPCRRESCRKDFLVKRLYDLFCTVIQDLYYCMCGCCKRSLFASLWIWATVWANFGNVLGFVGKWSFAQWYGQTDISYSGST